jgi:hypothetical protein
MSESTTLIAPATAAQKMLVEPLFEPVRLGRYDLPQRMVMAPLTRSRAPASPATCHLLSMPATTRKGPRRLSS